MNENLKMNISPAVYYVSFKWCVEYLKNWNNDQIQSDVNILNDYLTGLAERDPQSNQEGQEMVTQMITLTNRLVGAEMALKAREENCVQERIEQLTTTIQEIKKEYS